VSVDGTGDREGVLADPWDGLAPPELAAGLVALERHAPTEATKMDTRTIVIVRPPVRRMAHLLRRTIDPGSKLERRSAKSCGKLTHGQRTTGVQIAR
jgi:hypothetical protein